MATRWSLPSTGTAEVSPARASLWNNTLTLRTPLTKTKLNSAKSFKSAGYSASSPTNRLLVQLVSPPLATQSLAGTWTLIAAAFENLAGGNASLQMHIRVVNNAGSADRGIIYAGHSVANNATVGAIGEEFIAGGADTTRKMVVTGTNVNVQAGDRLVIEVGFRGDVTDSVTYNAEIDLGDNGTDFASSSGIVEDGGRTKDGWVEVDVDVRFQVVKDLNASWNTKSKVGKNLGVVWNTLPKVVGKNLGLTWNILNVIESVSAPYVEYYFVDPDQPSLSGGPWEYSTRYNPTLGESYSIAIKNEEIYNSSKGSYVEPHFARHTTKPFTPHMTAQLDVITYDPGGGSLSGPAIMMPFVNGANMDLTGSFYVFAVTGANWDTAGLYKKPAGSSVLVPICPTVPITPLDVNSGYSNRLKVSLYDGWEDPDYFEDVIIGYVNGDPVIFCAVSVAPLDEVNSDRGFGVFLAGGKVETWDNFEGIGHEDSTPQITLKWNVVATQPVGRSLQAIWNTKALASKALSTPWNAKTLVGKSLEFNWGVVAAPTPSVFVELNVRWNVRAPVGSNLNNQWNVRVPVGKSLEINWPTRMLAMRELVEIWNVRTSVSKTGQLIWRVLIPAGKSIQEIWNVKSLTRSDLRLLWDLESLRGIWDRVVESDDPDWGSAQQIGETGWEESQVVASDIWTKTQEVSTDYDQTERSDDIWAPVKKPIGQGR